MTPVQTHLILDYIKAHADTGIALNGGYYLVDEGFERYARSRGLTSDVLRNSPAAAYYDTSTNSFLRADSEKNLQLCLHGETLNHLTQNRELGSWEQAR